MGPSCEPAVANFETCNLNACRTGCNFQGAPSPKNDRRHGALRGDGATPLSTEERGGCLRISHPGLAGKTAYIQQLIVTTTLVSLCLFRGLGACSGEVGNTWALRGALGFGSLSHACPFRASTIDMTAPKMRWPHQPGPHMPSGALPTIRQSTASLAREKTMKFLSLKICFYRETTKIANT